MNSICNHECHGGREGKHFCSAGSVYYKMDKEIVRNVLEVLMFKVISTRFHVSTQWSNLS